MSFALNKPAFIPLNVIATLSIFLYLDAAVAFFNMILKISN